MSKIKILRTSISFTSKNKRDYFYELLNKIKKRANFKNNEEALIKVLEYYLENELIE